MSFIIHVLYYCLKDLKSEDIIPPLEVFDDLTLFSGNVISIQTLRDIATLHLALSDAVTKAINSSSAYSKETQAQAVEQLRNFLHVANTIDNPQLGYVTSAQVDIELHVDI